MKKKLKVGLVGASGRMGQEIAEILKTKNNFELHLAVCRQASLAEFAYTRQTPSCPEAKEVDVWIDFSSPEGLGKLLSVATKNQTPVVSGTTGLSSADQAALKKASAKIPVLWASNMSLGVAVVMEALEVFSRIRQFDFQIEEFHHNRKKDKPSGTAKSLQEKLEKVVGRELPEPLSIRGGGIFGVHKVHAMAEEEHIVFEHMALNRAVFARGAVEAAQWLCSKKKGFYSMRDVLYNEG
ncbi:4-hydroxy-tetrahydrodipicolinate reductase [Bdellovibrio sp. HCB337]|uniref:4-hydroxy-tetrahydrodipicolinate reductase n=1 Tax=Bdellovibrio sp. HCB337 TaxID=3394358 RepID=UPI0039A6A19B